MNISQVKDKIVDICTDLGNCLPYDRGDIECDDVRSLIDEIVELGSVIDQSHCEMGTLEDKLRAELQSESQ